MKCASRGNGIVILENGDSIVFLRWVTSIKGKQYFIASDKNGKEVICHVMARDENNKIVEIEKVK